METYVQSDLNIFNNSTQSNSSELGFVPESQIKSVPSRGISYPEGWEIYCRPYLFGEIQYLNSSSLSRKEVITKYLSGIRTNFDPMLLTYADFLFIVLMRRVASIGPDVASCKFICTDCGKKNTQIISVTSIEYDELSVPALPIKAHLSFGDMCFMPFTLGNYISALDKNKEDDMVYIYSLCCSSMDVEDAYAKLSSVYSSTDMEIINKVGVLLYHQLKASLLKCTSCGTVNQIELDGDYVLIAPFRESEDFITNSISFGA